MANYDFSNPALLGPEALQLRDAGKDAVSEKTDWMIERGFQLVLDPLRGGYVEGFDRDREYQFMREEWDEPHVFRLADSHPAFNVWGLRYRPLPPSPS